VLERAVSMARPGLVSTRADLCGRVEAVARQLEVTAPGMDEIKQHARSTKPDRRS
jgi:hypothetical protein